MDQDIEHTYEVLGAIIDQADSDEEFVEFLGIASVAFQAVCNGGSRAAQDLLDSLSTWELGQVAANADRLRTLAQELLARRGKS